MLAPLFMSKENLANKFVPEELFAVTKKRTELDITAGEEIVVVGYPSGIRQGKTNLPLIRQGIIATRIGEELHEEVPGPSGKISTRVSRGFLIRWCHHSWFQWFTGGPQACDGTV